VTFIAHRTGNVPIHAIVTETAASLFGMLSYRDTKAPLAAMSWGAEDLSAALGASSKYGADGELSFTYKLARSLTLAGAVAAKVQPVDGVFADYKDDAGLEAEARAAASEGFTGKLAIHPIRSRSSTPPSRHRLPKSRMPKRLSPPLQPTPKLGCCRLAVGWSIAPICFRRREFSPGRANIQVQET
jgi:hypothetical protein